MEEKALCAIIIKLLNGGKIKLRNKIDVAEEIINWENPIRGIYGIFIKDNAGVYCAYVGRTNNMYLRFFSGTGEYKGHLVSIRNGDCKNKRITDALENKDATIVIKVLEEVKCQYDNYNKDMQRLAFAEYYHISKYQELNQCLEQLPDGRNMDRAKWDQVARLENC